MADDEVEYLFEKGKGWVAYSKSPLKPGYFGSLLETAYVGYNYGIVPGTAVSSSDGTLVGHVISYENGVATIQLTQSIQHVTINATIEI